MRLRPTIRLRLTAWYAGTLLACGAALLGASLYVVRSEFEPAVELRPGPPQAPAPAPAGGSQGEVIARAADPAEVERRVRADEQRQDEEALGDVVGWFAAMLGLVTIASVGIGWLVAGRALAPVSRITATAQRVSGQSLHERIALEGPRDELKELADTFDAMLARLDATFESHRRFVANASHELRTPLAIIRAELEELLESGPLHGEQHAMLANARRAATRSEHLIASLLTLARSEGDLQQRTPVDVAALVDEALDASRCAPLDGVRISTELEPAVVAGDPILLESLAVNLIENGLRYNERDGVLHVATAAGDGDAVLSVANTGPVLTAEEVERLFDAFSRGDRARTSDGGGFGLGLSIVRAVATAHGGTVDASPREGGGLSVTVRLPAAAEAAAEPRRRVAPAPDGV